MGFPPVPRLGLEPSDPSAEGAKRQQFPATCQDASSPACTGQASEGVGTPPATATLLQLLAQLAALPADQRAALARLLALPAEQDRNQARTLDDKFPPGFERGGGTG